MGALDTATAMIVGRQVSGSVIIVLVLLGPLVTIVPAVPTASPIQGGSYLPNEASSTPSHSNSSFMGLSPGSTTGCSGVGSGKYYEVIFNESGLSSETLTSTGGWSVVFNDTTSTYSSSTVVNGPGPTSICVNALNGTGYSFWVYPYPGYAAFPLRGPISVAGFNLSQNISFEPKFPVVFNETGLPLGTNWTVAVAGNVLNSTNSTIDYSEPNGTYPFSVGPIAGFSPLPSYGSITVKGSDVTLNITFALNYTVTFEEAGLPVGTAWSATIGGVNLDSRTSLIVFAEPNGTFAYTISSEPAYTATPNAGSITVAGQDKVLSVAFYPTFSATVGFVETGFPSGTTWSVTLEGTIRASSTSEIKFQEFNGSYSFSILSLIGFTMTPNSGTIIVNGSNLEVAIRFVPRTYLVTFSESGNPPGASWVVALGGATNSSAGGTIEFVELNGTFPFTVTAGSPRWQSATPDGFVGVSGSDQTVNITFLFAYRLNVAESGLPPGTEWYFNLSGTPTLHPAAHALITPNLDFMSSASQAAYHQSNASRTEAMTWWLPNGSYAYVVSSSLPGLKMSDLFGNVSIVGGSPAALQEAFLIPSQYNPPQSFDQLPILFVIGLAAALGICLAVWVLLRRRPPPAPPPPPPPTYPNFPEDVASRSVEPAAVEEANLID